ncbi:MAG: MoxR family ATPase [Myxococcales bacterium]|nr:MoxR family ATPase [Myxococcales bacterium]
MNPEAIGEVCDRIKREVAKVLVGQEELVELVLTAILARGHVLIEGVPGLGKTLLVRTLARVLGCESRRIQFTPDLMPADVTGGSVFNQQRQEFDFVPGPVFTQLLLGDEINRAPAKTQSALLEAMQERSVTTDGVTRALPRPFFVVATQNPVESQGTYPLPEAQLDRFLMKIEVTHPSREVEKRILQNHVAGFDATALAGAGLQTVTSAAEVEAMQGALTQVRVDDELLDYITDIVGRTRSHRSIDLGASPRASIALLAGARASAAMQRRGFITPDDIKALAPAVLRHRVILVPDAEFEGITPGECVREILAEAKVPKSAA